MVEDDGGTILCICLFICLFKFRYTTNNDWGSVNNWRLGLKLRKAVLLTVRAGLASNPGANNSALTNSTVSGPQNVYGPQNVGFCENWFLMLAIKQYMAKWYLTSSFDIHYEIQTGGANLYQYFWFVPHHCRSNVAD